jgi:hypothetical protein
LEAEIGWSNGWPMAPASPSGLPRKRWPLTAVCSPPRDDDEYSDARVELTLALGRAPWQHDVWAASTDEPPAYIKGPWRIEDYKKTREVRRELERAKAMW